MTSLRQIEANRRNSQRSTGPKTDNGKQRASQNAVRHGLTAETVITPLEDPEDYKAFEQAVTADYEAETAVERELVLRLASLLWRLRRATSIETGLLKIQREIPYHPTATPQSYPSHDCGATVFPLDELTGVRSDDAGDGTHRDGFHSVAGLAPISASGAPDRQRDVARRFLLLADLDDTVFERLGRYEAALWRQLRQTLFVLERLRWRTPSARRWRTQHSWQRTMAPLPDTD
jgi:hypothetical protein